MLNVKKNKQKYSLCGCSECLRSGKKSSKFYLLWQGCLFFQEMCLAMPGFFFLLGIVSSAALVMPPFQWEKNNCQALFENTQTLNEAHLPHITLKCIDVFISRELREKFKHPSTVSVDLRI